MNTIWHSASKLVFILLAITACVAFMIGKLEAKEFMILATGAFTFYFSAKGDPTAPYNGK